jgi:hypothetical protein
MHFNMTKIFTVGLFIVLLYTGFFLAQRKPLWNDEIFTQEQSLDNHSYKDILTLNFIEGNKSPIYYMIQKFTCDIFSFHMPSRAPQTSDSIPRIHDSKGQLIMRIPSNVFMSLGVVLIFYFFVRYFSFSTGLYALTVALTTPMVWVYWVEARPYSLWFLLTVLQLFFAWGTVITEKETSGNRRGLIIVQLLLALTTVASLFQIVIVSFLLWCRKYYRKEMFWTTVIPIGIALFYYIVAPLFKFKTYFFWANLTDAIMPEHIVIYGLYAFVFWKDPKNTFFLKTFLLFLASGCFVLLTHLHTPGIVFGFYSRYLIYLVPVDIMLMTAASYGFFQASKKNTYVLMNVLIVLSGLLFIRGLLTYRALLASGLYLHSPG